MSVINIDHTGSYNCRNRHFQITVSTSGTWGIQYQLDVTLYKNNQHYKSWSKHAYNGLSYNFDEYFTGSNYGGTYRYKVRALAKDRHSGNYIVEVKSAPRLDLYVNYETNYLLIDVHNADANKIGYLFIKNTLTNDGTLTSFYSNSSGKGRVGFFLPVLTQTTYYTVETDMGCGYITGVNIKAPNHPDLTVNSDMNYNTKKLTLTVTSLGSPVGNSLLEFRNANDNIIRAYKTNTYGVVVIDLGNNYSGNHRVWPFAPGIYRAFDLYISQDPLEVESAINYSNNSLLFLISNSDINSAKNIKLTNNVNSDELLVPYTTDQDGKACVIYVLPEINQDVIYDAHITSEGSGNVLSHIHVKSEQPFNINSTYHFDHNTKNLTFQLDAESDDPSINTQELINNVDIKLFDSNTQIVNTVSTNNDGFASINLGGGSHVGKYIARYILNGIYFETEVCISQMPLIGLGFDPTTFTLLIYIDKNYICDVSGKFTVKRDGEIILDVPYFHNKDDNDFSIHIGEPYGGLYNIHAEFENTFFDYNLLIENGSF